MVGEKKAILCKYADRFLWPYLNANLDSIYSVVLFIFTKMREVDSLTQLN